MKYLFAEEYVMDEIIAKLDEYIRERCEVDDDPEYGLDVNLFDTGFLPSTSSCLPRRPSALK